MKNRLLYWGLCFVFGLLIGVFNIGTIWLLGLNTSGRVLLFLVAVPVLAWICSYWVVHWCNEEE
jgi:hypothetical protein